MLKKVLATISIVIITACQSPTLLVSPGEVEKERRSSNRTVPSKYNGKELTVRGFTYFEAVMPQNETEQGTIALTEKGGNMSQIICQFGKKNAAEFSKIKGGQFVTVKGIENADNEVLTSCSVVKVEPGANYPVSFVDRTTVFPPDKEPNRQMLVVEIDEDGKLTLNQMSEVNDLKLLSEKLNEIFANRAATPGEREVIIDPKGSFNKPDLARLIESLLADVKASSILVIKNNSQ